MSESLPRQWRMTVRGPGPHRIDHDLGTSRIVVNVLSDTGQQYMSRIDHLDKNSLELEIGYFSLPARDWVVGCNDDALVHVWVLA